MTFAVFALITKRQNKTSIFDIWMWKDSSYLLKVEQKGSGSPANPKAALVKPKRSKTTGPTMFAISAGTHQGATRQFSVEKSQLPSSLFLRQKLQKQRLALLAI